MNLDFMIAAARTFEKRAQKGEATGDVEYAKKNYQLAISKYQELMRAFPAQKRQFCDAVETCETKLEELNTAAPVQRESRDRTRSAQPAGQREERQSAPAESSQKEVGGEQEQNENSIFEGYDLDISQPTEKLSFDDLIGLEKAKIAIHEKLIYPLKYPEKYTRRGLGVGGFILLEGPPGTGKTTFAKVVASVVDMPFINVDCTSLVDSLIGKSGKNIKHLFDEVRRFIKDKDMPVVMLFDDFEKLVKKRTSDDKTSSETVPTMLTEMQGFESNNNKIIILASTNLKSSLDPAILERFSQSILIPLPDFESRKKIFKLKLKKYNTEDEIIDSLNFDELSNASDGLSGRDIHNIAENFAHYLVEKDIGVRRDDRPMQEVLMELVKDRKQMKS